MQSRCVQESRTVLVWEKENEAGAEPRVKGLAGAMHREQRREGMDARPAHLLGLDRGVWAISGKPVWSYAELILGLSLGLCCGPAKGWKLDNKWAYILGSNRPNQKWAKDIE